ncbi:hypothetical protein RhiirA1_422787, partial [Rhizophagus irregularis]
MVILNYRSSYLRRILSTNKKKNDGTLVHIKLPNISPEIFQTILRYIYGGEPSLKNYDNLDIIKIIVAASELNLQELVIYTQSFLINYKTSWIEQNFSLVYQTSFENDSLLELQEYCTNLISKNPDKIFKSIDFSSIPEKILISLIKSDNLQMDEIKVWENVLKWGLAQNPELSSDPSNYLKEDFNSLKNTLQQCIPFVRFHNLTSKEFSNKILPYKEVLPEELFVDLLKSFLDLHPDSKINHKSKPRIPKELLPTSAATIDDERKPISRHNETSSLWNHAPPKSSRDNALPKGPREALISSKNKANYAPPKGSWSNKPGNEPTSSWNNIPPKKILILSKQIKANYAHTKGSWSNKPPISSWDNEPTTEWDNEPTTEWVNEPSTEWDNEPPSSWNNISWETLISSKRNKANYAPPKGSWSNKPGNEPISSWDKEPTISWDKEPSTSRDKEPSTSWDKEPSTSWDKEPSTSWDKEPTSSWDNEPTRSWGNEPT